jgi:hypothetical protein
MKTRRVELKLPEESSIVFEVVKVFYRTDKSRLWLRQILLKPIFDGLG